MKRVDGEIKKKEEKALNVRLNTDSFSLINIQFTAGGGRDVEKIQKHVNSVKYACFTHTERYL